MNAKEHQRYFAARAREHNIRNGIIYFPIALRTPCLVFREDRYDWRCMRNIDALAAYDAAEDAARSA